jgi:hypothetical protein
MEKNLKDNEFRNRKEKEEEAKKALEKKQLELSRK